MNASLPLLLPVAEIQKRLLEIFPEGMPNRGYCTREIAAKTIFTMLYVGAVEYRGVHLRPNQVTRMTDRQSAKTSEAAWLAWRQSSLAKETGNIPGRWYAVDTREPIRDETLRDGLVPTGAVIVKPNLPTTSSVPRYALAAGFAELLDPNLSPEALAQAIAAWQVGKLSASALARVEFMRRGVVATEYGVMVTFANGKNETLRDGLVPTGAVIVKPNLPTTSSVPRYALAAGFAELLDPNLSPEALAQAIAAWQVGKLSASALARVEFMRRGVVATEYGVMVTFANGETRKLAAGPSSIITKAVVEEFSKRFLANPGVIFLSESGNKVVERDDRLAQAVGLTIPADRYLPDILLVDLGPQHPLLVFVEVVATDGPITASRKQAFLEITRAAGFPDSSIAFVTAYLDRSQAAFRKTAPELAWNSFAWFAAEPDHIVAFRQGTHGNNVRLSDLL
jgi:hypothetical protein